MKHRRSNSTGMCTLPIIPEYPGFQDFKAELPKFFREKAMVQSNPGVQKPAAAPGSLKQAEVPWNSCENGGNGRAVTLKIQGTLKRGHGKTTFDTVHFWQNFLPQPIKDSQDGCSLEVNLKTPTGVHREAFLWSEPFFGSQVAQVSRKYLETPAFNRLFPDWERGKSSSSQLNCFPRRPSLVPCLGSSSRRGSLKGHPTSSSSFRDKPLEEYFKERLMELRKYDGKRSNRKAKVSADQNQDPFLSHRGSEHRSSCGAGTGHSKESRETCGSAHPENKEVMDSNHQEETQNVLDLYTGDFLDFLTMYITTPLEAFVQKK